MLNPQGRFSPPWAGSHSIRPKLVMLLSHPTIYSVSYSSFQPVAQLGIHSVSQLSNQLFSHSASCAATQPVVQPLSQLFSHSASCSGTQPVVQPLSQLFSHSASCSASHSFLYPVIYPVSHLRSQSFIHSISCSGSR